MQNVANILEASYKSKIKESLKKSYRDALKDPKFKTLVGKINLSEDVLIKYTSRLEESSIEYNNCMNCSNKLECLNKIKGYALLPKVVNGELTFNYKACKYEQKEIKNNKYKENIYTFDMPDGISDASMKNIYKKDTSRVEAIKWLTNFINDYKNGNANKGLFLHGTFGCGKSYLISAMFNELAKENVKSAIIFWPEYLTELKSSFNSDFKEKNYFKEKFNYIKKVPLLLIDDIGAENVTAWNRDEIFCPLVQYRMDHKLPTFFTSNLNIQELEYHFAFSKNGDEVIKARRIIERVKQLSDDIELISKNLRK